MTVDGVDFPIQEPTPFSKKWWSHKFDGAGLRYEVAVTINTGDIVAFHGPFPCGSFPDLKIFRLGIKPLLGPGEKVIADRGYRGDTRTCTPDNHLNLKHRQAMKRARARHETINGRLKKWRILKDVFRHRILKHNYIFRCVLVIVQIEIENGNAPFQVTNYYDPATAEV